MPVRRATTPEELSRRKRRRFEAKRWRHACRKQGRRRYRLWAGLPFGVGMVYRCLARLHVNLTAFRQAFRWWRPLRRLRFWLGTVMTVLGAVLAAALLFSPYDRALVLSGRTEVVSMRLSDPAFGILSFDNAIYRADPDQEAQIGQLELEIARDTTVRVVRIGNGPVRLSFTAGPNALPDARCGPGGQVVGSALASDALGPLCETGFVQIPFKKDGQPLVVALGGDLVVGEEVSQGAGPRPILLNATASLLVRHQGWLFRRICAWNVLEHICRRFTANETVLAPGNSIRPAGSPGVELGFIRIDPADSASGMMFSVAAPANAFAVTRMEGETFTVRESLFQVIEKSPLIWTLNTSLVAVSVVWFFVRMAEKRALAVVLLLGASLLAPGRAEAQQALLKVDEEGQAMLRARGDRCYAITVAHVMGQETSARVTAPGRELGEGDLLRRIPAAPEPIVLLTTRYLPAKVCPPFEGPVALDEVLQSNAVASLRLVRADGSIDRIPLLLSSVEVETLEVKAAGTPMEQGMSGGTVFVADQPAGLLVDVTDGGQTGRVMRLDRVFERLAPHLASGVAALPPPAVAAGGVGYEIVRSTAEPVSSNNLTSSLQGEGAGPWRVPAEGRVELVLKVGKPVSGVTLDLTGLDDPPRTVEVLGGRGEGGPWQSLATFILEPGDGVIARQFPTVRLPYLWMRISGFAGKKTIALDRINLTNN